jgi:hypothetical protein
MKMETLLQSFSIRLWIAVAATVTFLIMLLRTIQHLRLHYERVGKEDLRILNSVFLIFTIFLQQGTENLLKSFLLNNVFYSNNFWVTWTYLVQTRVIKATHYSSLSTMNRLTFFRKIFVLFCENIMTPINMKCRQDAHIFNIKTGVILWCHKPHFRSK